MAALMKQRVIWVLTHDSIGLGEDGPTHQPIEHVSSLRLIPNVDVWRPADAFETAIAWQAAVERKDGPTLLALSRQNLAPLTHRAADYDEALRGGYIVYEPMGRPDSLIMATGSEVGLAIAAAKKLADSGHSTRVVSLPCVTRFLQQDKAYRESVLPKELTRRIAVEAGVTHYWRALTGTAGDVVGIDSFGESAPAGKLFEHFGLTVDNIAARMNALFA